MGCLTMEMKITPWVQYGCIYLPINIWNFFLESIFLYALFCDLKCYLCSQIADKNVNNVTGADLFGYQLLIVLET